MQGSMHTVAGFVDAAGSVGLLDEIADCTTAQDIGKADNYLFARSLPSRLSPEVVADIKAVTRKGVVALGLEDTPIHAELMLTKTGPKIIEIGARMGGYRPRMYGLSTGIDMYQAAIDTALGNIPILQPTHTKACTVLEIFSEEMAPFGAVPQLDEIQNLLSCQYVRVQAKPGNLTGRAADGFRAPLVVLLAHDEVAQVERDMQWILEHVVIQLQPA